MPEAEVAYLSATGEVKIPLRLRVQMGLQAGEKFSVQAHGQTLVLERVGLPTEQQIKEFLDWTKKNPRSRPVHLPASRAPTRRVAAAKKKAKRRR